jgi:uncharacterized protein
VLASALHLVENALDRVGGLDALWVYGSQATGKTTPSSDVDLAVLFTRRPSPEALVCARAEIEGILGRAVDLLDLEQASPILAMQALRHGKLVVDREPRHRVRFMTYLPGRYEDVMDLRRPLERLLRARLAHGRA